MILILTENEVRSINSKDDCELLQGDLENWAHKWNMCFSPRFWKGKDNFSITKMILMLKTK